MPLQISKRRTGKPVVTSNQASAWAMLHYAGIDYQPQGYGELFKYALPQHDDSRLAKNI